MELVRNGVTVQQWPSSGWHTQLEWSDSTTLDEACLTSRYLGRFAYYYVRVTCDSGAQAWSSPLWFAERV